MAPSKNLMVYGALLCYTMLVAWFSVAFSFNVYAVLVLMAGLPLGYFLSAARWNLRSVAWLALAAAVFTLVVGVFAYLNGTWFETSPTEWRLFGLVPVEAALAAFLHILYTVAVYEYFFDDRVSAHDLVHKDVYLMVLLTLGSLALAYVYLFSQVLFTFAYAWLIGALMFCIGFALLLLHRSRQALIRRVAVFTVAMLPLSLAYEYIALSNNLRFFANVNEYLYAFTWFGQVVPVEEFLFILLLPSFIALFYELFFDDER
jgi:hypothetical protein